MRLLVAVIFVGIGGLAGTAEACGGCFCTVTSVEPVDQSAERILFELDEDVSGTPTTVTAHVQIAYTGAAEAFAWVVPVPSLPRDFGTSSNQMFDEIELATAPTFTFITGSAGSTPGCFGCCSGSVRAAEGGGDGGDVEEVTVWGTENVGPFETATVSSDDGGALYDWLVRYGYEVPPEAEPIIASYAMTGSFFIAMKLEPGADVSQIEPLRFTYDGNEPCIPLKLTAIATEPDLPVLAFVFASARTIPENFAQVEPNWDAIARFDDGTTNYADLVSEAADAAGGRAFVTEFAGRTDAIGRGGYYYGGGFTPTDPTLADVVSRHGYLTRLFTTISANEMTVDPIFHLDAAAPDVSNFRTFDQTTAAGVLAMKSGQVPEVATARSLGWETAVGGALGLLLLAALVRRKRAHPIRD